MDEDVLAKYRKAGGIAKAAREYGASRITEGALLFQVAEDIENFIRKQGGEPAFPINLAINDAAAHFTPSHDDKLRFQRGDVIKLDVGAHVEGYIGDTAVTVEVGTLNWSDLIKASREALDAAVELMKPRTKLDDVGGAIQRVVEAYGFLPVENLTGHSMEQFKLHAGLSVPNVYGDGSSGQVREGDVVAIEPFATDGTGRVDGKKGGNIYRMIRARQIGGKDLASLINHIQEHYPKLPFSERWCHKVDRKSKPHIKKLVRTGIIYSYPVLRDVGGGTVSQAEHTVIITADGCEVIT